MNSTDGAYRNALRRAVRGFWRTRTDQHRRQGRETGQRDQGGRSAVTGGRHMDSFVDLVRSVAIDAGVSTEHLHCRQKCELPGYFRAEKRWDLVVVVEGSLLAAVEFKSQVGPSFGNNFNNRSEEALGSSTDLWTAYREGALRPSVRPWLGYLTLVEEAAESTSPVESRSPHFPALPEFRGTSYLQRYELLLTCSVEIPRC